MIASVREWTVQDLYRRRVSEHSVRGRLRSRDWGGTSMWIGPSRLNVRGMIRFARVLVFASIIALTLSTQTAESAEGIGPHRFWSDVAVFRIGEESSNGYVEVYFELKRADFTFRLVDGTLRADVFASVGVTDASGAPFDSVGGMFVAMARDSSDLNDQDYTMFFACALELPPGRFTLNAVATDLMTQTSSRAIFPVVVPDFDSDTLSLSDIEFGYNVLIASPDSGNARMDVLVKNGYKIYPDCRGLVGESRARLYFYCEAYNFDFDSQRDDTYVLAYSIVPTDGSPTVPLGTQSPSKPGRSAVLASDVAVDNLTPGIYHFRIDIEDPATGQRAWSEKLFHVVKPPPDTLTEDEIDRIRDIITYIARQTELDLFERLNSEGKRNFMFRFWLDRDPTPRTPTNEFRQEHMRRMNFANERYSIGFRDRAGGWRTDRGRAYIVYGPPDEIQRYPFTPDNPPAEQWFYDNLPNQGNAYFLFLDEAGFGDYRLVQSSARGERRDPYWEDFLRQGDYDRPR